MAFHLLGYSFILLQLNTLNIYSAKENIFKINIEFKSKIENLKLINLKLLLQQLFN